MRGFVGIDCATRCDAILQRRLNSRDDAELRPLFDKVRAADVAFTNLEGLANDYRGDPALESGGSHFGAPAWVLDELVAAGFDLFATATNHALDYSIQGLVHTIEALEARGLSFAGVGRTLEDARRPCYHTSPAGTVNRLTSVRLMPSLRSSAVREAYHFLSGHHRA